MGIKRLKINNSNKDVFRKLLALLVKKGILTKSDIRLLTQQSIFLNKKLNDGIR